MSLSPALLIAEAERLVARAERKVQRHRSVSHESEAAQRAERELQRLRLYRTVLTGARSASALMPEYIAARGLADLSREGHGRTRG
jgi:hypothetical protein